MSNYEWDENKRLANAKTHSLDFRDAISIFDGDIVEIEDNRFDYGERRFIALGLLQSQVIVVVYTERIDAIRIISARKATKYEQITYFKQIAD